MAKHPTISIKAHSVSGHSVTCSSCPFGVWQPTRRDADDVAAEHLVDHVHGRVR